MESGLITPHEYFSHDFSLNQINQINQAFETFYNKTGAALKVLIRP